MKLILKVLIGDYGVASVDEECLVLITYLRMTKTECKIIYVRNILFHKLPCLIVQEDDNSIQYIYSFNCIWRFLQQVINLEYFVNSTSQTIAVHKFITSDLIPGIQFSLWMNENNYEKITRPWYRNALYFPVSFIYPYYKSKNVERYFRVNFPKLSPQEYKDKIFYTAQTGIRALSLKLGSDSYFSKYSSPSQLDAIIFGYLAPYYYLAIPDSPIHTELNNNRNLVDYLNKIKNEYFSDISNEAKYLASGEDDSDERTPILTVILAAFCATAAMFSYGVGIGIIRMPLLK